MIKKVFGRKLSRDRGSRTALFRSLIKAFVECGKIVTTKAKAKAVQPDIERLVSLSKTKDLSKIRQVFSFLGNDSQTTERLFGSVAKAFEGRRGGYTRIINLPRRKGDMAEMARIEWTEKVDLSNKELKGKEKSKKTKTPEIKKEEKPKNLRQRISGLRNRSVKSVK